MFSISHWKCLALASLLLICSTASAQLTIVEEQAAGTTLSKYSRFQHDFFEPGMDLSGAGRTTVTMPGQDAILDHGTLISASFHLAAKHGNRHPRDPDWLYPDGELLRFYYADVRASAGETSAQLNARLADSSNFEERRVDDSWHVGNTGDLQAGSLLTPVSADIAVYPIMLFQNLNDYKDLEVVTFGKPRGSNTSQRHHRVARSVIQSASVHDTISYKWPTGTEEGYPISGDSGSPTLANAPNGWGLTFVGAHWTARGDSGITTAAARDSLRQEMIDRQPGVAAELQEVPTFWTGILGDFDGSFGINAADLDIVSREAARVSFGYNWYLDWDMDGDVDASDVDLVLAEVGKKRGDTDLNGDVSFADFLVLSSNFGVSTGMGWADGDCDGDGDVDFTDYLILSANFGT